jgi:hypothetical protein
MVLGDELGGKLQNSTKLTSGIVEQKLEIDAASYRGAAPSWKSRGGPPRATVMTANWRAHPAHGAAVTQVAAGSIKDRPGCGHAGCRPGSRALPQIDLQWRSLSR